MPRVGTLVVCMVIIAIIIGGFFTIADAKRTVKLRVAKEKANEKANEALVRNKILSQGEELVKAKFTAAFLHNRISESTYREAMSLLNGELSDE